MMASKPDKAEQTAPAVAIEQKTFPLHQPGAVEQALPCGHNLPAPITRFVGRQDELSLLHGLLRHERVITLVGPGGAGKTRLAVQAGWQALPDFEDGVWIVPLMAVTSPDLFYFAISEALQLPANSGIDPQKQIVNHLRGKHLLLILDNFEQLIPAAGLLPGLLQQAPQVTALITSRERLNLYGECTFDLAGMDNPQSATPEAVAASGAGLLFLQNAQRARPSFVLSPGNSAAIQRICLLVEGIPLALELAGTWVRAMSCEQIAAQIESDLDFLAAGWQDQPQRRRSMRALLEHSWSMLSPQEQQTLRRLSVLVGRFDLPAAQAVAAMTLPELVALVDKALLHWEASSERYEGHPLLKRYAAERLAENAAEQAEANQRHCRYFLEFTGQRQEALRGRQVGQALHEISEVIGDVRQAWNWALQNSQWELLDASIEGLFQFYNIRSRYADGAELFGTSAENLSQLATAGPTAQALFLRLRLYQAAFIARLRRISEARQICEACLPALRDLDRPADTGLCLNQLGLAAALQGQHAEAALWLAEALSIARDRSLQILEADILTNQSENYERQGNLAEAGLAIEQAGQIYHALGDSRGEAHACYLRGWVVIQQGHYLQAQALFHQSFEISQELGDLFGQSSSLDALASAQRRQGYYDNAVENRRQALALIQQTGSQHGEAVAISNLGTDLMNLGDYVSAQAQYQRSLAIYRELGLRRNQSIDLHNLATLALYAGDLNAALDTVRQGLEIAQADGDQFVSGVCFILQGRIFFEQGKHSEAGSAYSQALALAEVSGQNAWILEIQANLARLAMAQDKAGEALTQIEPAWQALQNNAVDLADELYLYDICCQVFAEADDQRSGDALRMAHTRLQARTAWIKDEKLRRSFLENVLPNRAILRAFAAQEKTRVLKASPLPDPLTRQELGILHLLADGLTNQQISAQMVITVGTVKSHVHSIYRKLNAQNRTQAVARGRELGLL